MDRLHAHAVPAVFLTAAGVNALMGVALIARPLPVADLRTALARPWGGDERRVAHAEAALAGTAVAQRGKGVLLLGVAALLAYAVHRGDARTLRAVAGGVAAADVAALALWAAAAREDGYPRLPSEAAAAPALLSFAAAEALGLGWYAVWCTRKA
jgi:hypothetical protein